MRKLIYILNLLMICNISMAIDIGGSNMKDGKLLLGSKEVMRYDGTNNIMSVNLVYTNLNINTNIFGTVKANCVLYPIVTSNVVVYTNLLVSGTLSPDATGTYYFTNSLPNGGGGGLPGFISTTKINDIGQYYRIYETAYSRWNISAKDGPPGTKIEWWQTIGYPSTDGTYPIALPPYDTTVSGTATVISQYITNWIVITNWVSIGSFVFKPTSSNSYDLGSLLLPWRDLYIGSNSIYMGGSKVLSVSNGTLITGMPIASSNGISSTLSDGSVLPTTDWSFNNKKIVNLATCTSPNDAANKYYVDNLINGLSWQDHVITFTNTPPISVALGDRYVVKTNATGAFSAYTNYIAIATNVSPIGWQFIAPQNGWALYAFDTGLAYNYNSTTTNWVQMVGSSSWGNINGSISNQVDLWSYLSWVGLASNNVALLNTNNVFTFGSNSFAGTIYVPTGSFTRVNSSGGFWDNGVRITNSVGGAGTTNLFTGPGTTGLVTSTISDTNSVLTGNGQWTKASGLTNSAINGSVIMTSVDGNGTNYFYYVFPSMAYTGSNNTYSVGTTQSVDSLIVRSSLIASNDGRSVWGWGNLSMIDSSSMGSDIHGFFNQATISSNSYGASMHGGNASGIMVINDSSLGAQQRGFMSFGKAYIISARGASQFGYQDNANSLVTNNSGAGSLQLFDFSGVDAKTSSVSASACIVLGGGNASHKNSIVAGDGQVSHGDGSITSGSGFWSPRIHDTDGDGRSFWGGDSISGVAGGLSSISGGAKGASQHGYFINNVATISNAMGAGQCGYASNTGASISNTAGHGSLQLFYFNTPKTSVVTSAGSASIVLGAGTASNMNSIVAGDNQVSHGDGSVSAGGGFWDSGKRILPTTNYITGFNIDAGDSSISTNSKGYFRVPTSGNISKWVMRSDNSSTVVVSVAKCSAEQFPVASSIIASAPMILNNQKCVTNTSLTDWTTNVVAGDYLKYFVLTNSSATNLAIELTVDVP